MRPTPCTAILPANNPIRIALSQLSLYKRCVVAVMDRHFYR